MEGDRSGDALAAFFRRISTINLTLGPLFCDKAMKEGASANVHAEAEVFGFKKRRSMHFSDALVLIFETW